MRRFLILRESVGTIPAPTTVPQRKEDKVNGTLGWVEENGYKLPRCMKQYARVEL